MTGTSGGMVVRNEPVDPATPSFLAEAGAGMIVAGEVQA